MEKESVGTIRTICNLAKAELQKIILKLPQDTQLQKLGIAKNKHQRIAALRALRDSQPDILVNLFWLVEGRNLPDIQNNDIVPLKSNLLCLVEACRKLNIDWKMDNKRGILSVYTQTPPLLFKRSQTPFNTSTVGDICSDKDALNSIVKDVISVPFGICFLDPNCDEYFLPYRTHTSIDEIIETVKNSFELPVIVKPNNGSSGRDVTKCSSIDEVRAALGIIYDKSNDFYDNLALVEEFVDIKKEYRVVQFMQKIYLIYLKDTSKATQTDNISPLHWDGSKAKRIQDKSLTTKFEKFLSPIYNKIPINYCGYDIAEDKSGKLWLIEVNSKPQFSIFLSDNSPETMIEMYISILKSIQKKPIW